MSQDRTSTAPKEISGSPLPGEPAFLAVGKLRRPHGVHGEMLMDVLTDFPERLQPGTRLYVGPEHQPICLTNVRRHRQDMLVSFEGYSTPDSVGQLRNLILSVSAADRPALPEGEYYHHQLIGLNAVSEAGQALGKVVEILETGANDVLVVCAENGRKTLVPLVDEFIRQVDLAGGEVRIHLIPGMISDQE